MNVVKWGPDNEPWSLDSKYFRRREQTPYRLLVLIAPRDRAVRQLQQIYEAVVVPDNASTTEAQ